MKFCAIITTLGSFPILKAQDYIAGDKAIEYRTFFIIIWLFTLVGFQTLISTCWLYKKSENREDFLKKLFEQDKNEFYKYPLKTRKTQFVMGVLCFLFILSVIVLENDQYSSRLIFFAVCLPLILIFNYFRYKTFIES